MKKHQSDQTSFHTKKTRIGGSTPESDATAPSGGRLRQRHCTADKTARKKSHPPVPGADHEAADVAHADGPAQHPGQLGVGVAVGGGEGRDVDGVADGLVARGVDHVAQRLLGVLDAAALRVAVPQEDQLLLLPRPQPAHALPVHLRGPGVRGAERERMFRFI